MEGRQELRDKTVLITGASSGVGAELATLCQAAGCHLVLASRRPPSRELLDAGALFLKTDVTSEGDVTALKVAALARHGNGLDFLVLNAGGGMRTRPSTLTREAALSEMELNYLSAVRLTAAFLPALRRRGGQVVCISSLLAHVPAAAATQRAAYATSKAALEAWAGALRAELAAEAAHSGCPLVAVTVVVPGPAATSFAVAHTERASCPGFVPADFHIPSPVSLPPQSAQEVADAIVEAMLSRAPVHYTSAAVRAAAAAGRFLLE